MSPRKHTLDPTNPESCWCEPTRRADGSFLHKDPEGNFRAIPAGLTQEEANAEIGARLTEFREKKKGSPSEYAKRAGLRYPDLHKIEKGERGLTLPIAATLVRAWNYPGGLDGLLEGIVWDNPVSEPRGKGKRGAK